VRYTTISDFQLAIAAAEKAGIALKIAGECGQRKAPLERVAVHVGEPRVVMEYIIRDRLPQRQPRRDRE
jgi:hypothetical protein